MLTCFPLRILVVVVLYVANKLLITVGVYNWFSVSYLSDMLFVPFVVAVLQWIQRCKPSSLPITTNWRLEALLISFFSGAFFEGVVPIVDTSSTADWVDVFAYIAGAIVYLLIDNLLIKKTKRIKTECLS
jgi:hypothetical protein